MKGDGMDTGLIHMYFGDGKGKTTAAIGLAVRAAGCGKQVVFAQFLKGRQTGEITLLKNIGIKVIRSEKDMGFCFNMTDGQIETWRTEQSRLLDEIRGAVSGSEAVGLLVLDEALNAIDRELLDEEALKEFVLRKPEGLEIVLTGRPAPGWLMERADYVTEMKKHRHPFDKGIKARKSIEY